MGAASLPAALSQRVLKTQVGHPAACHFWLRRVKLFSPVLCYGSYSSSLGFTRPPSLDPDPPYSWQNPESFFADRFRCLRRDALSGRFRRLLAEAAIAHRLLMAEHQVGSASLFVRRTDNHRRGFTPLRTPPSDLSSHVLRKDTVAIMQQVFEPVLKSNRLASLF